MTRETVKLSNQRPKKYESPLGSDVVVEMVVLKQLGKSSPFFCFGILS